jgi:hypothetical protein|tara:strand:+ start:401 stop:661 length:261 start_codon:yes stop_codon:yes gene_type:complete
MDLYTLEDLSLREIKALLVGLNTIPITGVDAMFVGILQNKMQVQIKQIEDHLKAQQGDLNELTDTIESQERADNAWQQHDLDRSKK